MGTARMSAQGEAVMRKLTARRSDPEPLRKGIPKRGRMSAIRKERPMTERDYILPKLSKTFAIFGLEAWARVIR